MTESTKPKDHLREWQMFYALDDNGDGTIPASAIREALENAGLGDSDQRLCDLFADLDGLKTEVLDFPAFLEIIGPSRLLVERAIQGDLAIPDFADFSRRVAAMFSETAANSAGTQPDYIAPLQEWDADAFGASVVSIDGQVLQLGEATVDFSIQSMSKPFNYAFALEALGEEKVHAHIGMEPSGRPFNARVLLEDGTSRPHNPMINAGAIMTAALIKPELPVHKRLAHVREIWSRLIGGAGQPRFNAWMAQEEMRTGDINRSLGYMMKAAGVLPKGADAVDHDLRDALELYFSICSLEMTATEAATAAATLANGGVCPVTQERVLQSGVVRHCLSLMQMCGMYDGSGEFCFHIGLPAKSGVGGAVMLVVPGLMGVCFWSPKLDRNGNSVRGVEMAKRLTETYRLHLYDGVTAVGERIDPRVPIARWQASLASQALWAASDGDLRTLRRLNGEHADLQKGDYDMRSPMHLAAAEGNTETVAFLLERGADPNQPDRWGGCPLDDALLGGHEETIALLKEHGAQSGQAHHVATDGPSDQCDTYGDANTVVEMLWVAARGSVSGLRRLVALGVPISAADYDGRTALHLAAAENKPDAVRYLLAHGHPRHVRDRWNATPLDEARREGSDAVIELLNA
ncbi:MAG: glutaminase A [Bacteroidota bacterium]